MTGPDRNTLFWWLYIFVLTGAALFIAHSFIGVLVLGVFGYYAVRPIADKFGAITDSKELAAVLTVLVVLVPILVLTLYAGLRVVQQLQQRFEGDLIPMLVSEIFGVDLTDEGAGSLLQDPPTLGELATALSGSEVQQLLGILDMVSGILLVLTVAVTLSYALLVYDEAISKAFATLVEGREETVYSYALAVDTDLEAIYFGNFLFIIFMAFLGTVTYLATNFIAPPGMQIPMVFTLGALTGITSFIPFIVSKVVYVPIIGYLALKTTQDGSGQLAFVGALLVVYFFVLDIIPQSVIQPIIAGRQLNAMLLVFAYLLGPILFGWYGFFFMPIVFVLILEAVRIVLPELLHGEPIQAEPVVAQDTGASSEEMQSDGNTDPDAGADESEE